MSFSFVQAGTPNGAAGTATTITDTFAATVGNGNCVAGIVGWDNSAGATVTQVKDDQSNTYNLSTKITDTTNNQNAQIFWLGNITNSPITVTVTFSGTGAANRSITVVEYNGVLASSDPSDGQTGQFQSAPSGTDAQVSTTINTTADGDLIVGLAAQTATNANPTHGTGFTDRPTADLTSSAGIFAGLNVEDEVQTTHGSVQSTFTPGSNTGCVTFVLALKPGTVGTPTTAGFFIEDTTLQRLPQNMRNMKADPQFSTPAQPLPVNQNVAQPHAAGIVKIRMIGSD